jgi:ribosome maturation factor RimP
MQCRGVGLAHFFYGPNQPPVTDLKQEIQQQLSELDPAIDVVALERPATESLRLFVDHPDGVDLALCEQVTRQLQHLLADYSLEVSSPGPKYRRNSESAAESKESLQ